MKNIRSIVIALVALLGPALVRAQAPAAAPSVKSSTGSIGIMLSSETVWKDWLTANYPLKSALTKEQEKGLEELAAAQGDERVAAAVFKDGTAGALLAKFAPSKRTLARLTVLRWSPDGWKPLLRCGPKGVFDAKDAAVTPVSPVGVYQVYLQRRSEGLAFMITLGKAGDKLFGDVMDLTYDAGAVNYVWINDFDDHD